MTQSFYEFYKELELQCLNTQEVGELCFEAGAQSRQDEVDELQKRINEALRILDGMRHNGAYRAIDALKGKEND